MFIYKILSNEEYKKSNSCLIFDSLLLTNLYENIIEKKNYTDISSDNNKFYLNLLNNDFNKYIKQNYELKDLYNIIVVNDKIYKISFDFIKISPYKI